MIQGMKQFVGSAPASPKLCERFKEQHGYLLVWSILIMAFGSLVIVGLLTYVSVSLRVSGKALELAEEYFAADAAVMAVVADLVQGTDVLDAGYATPSVALNNNSANISISAAGSGFGPDAQYRYFDPRASGELNPLISGGQYNFQLNNVVPQSDFQVNWYYAPEVKSWQITVYEGAGTGGSVVATDNGTSTPGFLSVNGSLIAGGTYTVTFHNSSDSDTVSAPFGTEGGTGYTWIYTRAKKDYLITATAGNTAVVAYVRQEPGPTVSPNAAPTVTLLSWQAPAVTP